MEWVVARTDKVTTDNDIIGEFFVDGQAARVCWTLERTNVSIPPGRYPLRLTYSSRAAAGTLWTPRTDYRLPEICSVPGRIGIRVHAANEAKQLEGCVAVGDDHTAHTITGSRDALTRICALLAAAEADHTDVWITISVPTQVTP
jgi:hypothetical protein